jgi:hypothetical protein
VDVAALAARLRALADDLPSPGIDTADTCLETACAELTEAGRESNTEIGLRRLAAARTHLAEARDRLAEARTAVDDYLASIGATGKPSAPGPAGGTPVSAPPQRPADPAQWWTDRVNDLCGRDGRAEQDAAPPTTVFNELLRAAANGDADAYHRRLRDAGPDTGVKLAGLAWPLIRTLAAEHLGRQPTARDVDGLRDRTADRVRAVVPKADRDAVAAALASACTLGPPKRDGGNDAAATSAIGPALVAALHRLGKTEKKG